MTLGDDSKVNDDRTISEAFCSYFHNVHQTDKKTQAAALLNTQQLATIVLDELNPTISDGSDGRHPALI